ERIPAWRLEECAAAFGREGAVPRSRALLRQLAYCEAHQQHSAEHRDLVAASRSHQRPEAHQLAHLLDRLPHPRADWRTGQDATQGSSGACRWTGGRSERACAGATLEETQAARGVVLTLSHPRGAAPWS